MREARVNVDNGIEDGDEEDDHELDETDRVDDEAEELFVDGVAIGVAAIVIGADVEAFAETDAAEAEDEADVADVETAVAAEDDGGAVVTPSAGAGSPSKPTSAGHEARAGRVVKHEMGSSAVFMEEDNEEGHEDEDEERAEETDTELTVATARLVVESASVASEVRSRAADGTLQVACACGRDGEDDELDTDEWAGVVRVCEDEGTGRRGCVCVNTACSETSGVQAGVWMRSYESRNWSVAPNKRCTPTSSPHSAVLSWPLPSASSRHALQCAPSAAQSPSFTSDLRKDKQHKLQRKRQAFIEHNIIGANVQKHHASPRQALTATHADMM